MTTSPHWNGLLDYLRTEIAIDGDKDESHEQGSNVTTAEHAIRSEGKQMCAGDRTAPVEALGGDGDRRDLGIDTRARNAATWRPQTDGDALRAPVKLEGSKDGPAPIRQPKRLSPSLAAMLGLIGPEHYLRLTGGTDTGWSKDARRLKSEQGLARFVELREKLT